MIPARIIAGGLLLVLGRKLFWFYVALLGFVAGLTVAGRLFHIQPEWVQIVIGIGFGVIGAVLAYFFQEIAIAVAGFLAGAYIAITLLTNLGGNPTPGNDALTWVVFLVGGIIGAALAFLLFDWALIVLTSLAGALLVVEGLSMTGLVSWLVVAGLFILGVIIQSSLERPPRQQTRSTPSSA